MTKTKKILAAVVAAVTTAVGGGILTGQPASALTSWQTFGYAEGRGEGTIGRTADGTLVVDTAGVYVDSTTNANPARMRFTIRGTGRAAVDWQLACWNVPGQLRVVAPPARMRTLPYTLDVSERLGGVRNYERCSVRVAAVSPREGWVRLSLQARY